MSEYRYTDEDGDRLDLYGFDTTRGERKVEVSVNSNSVYVTKEEAPAVALHILEAAGYSLESDYSMGSAVRGLKDHLHAKSVLAEREQLDSEAKAIYEAFAKESIFTRHQWEDLEDAKHPWIAAAKKARELHKGEAK